MSHPLMFWVLGALAASAAGRSAGGTSPRARTGWMDSRPWWQQSIGIVTELHMVVENAGDIRRFAGQDQLLKGFEALADALDKHDLDMGITWRSRTCRRRAAELTSQGRAYARRFLDRSDTSDIITVTGRVVEMDVPGSFNVKALVGADEPLI